MYRLATAKPSCTRCSLGKAHQKKKYPENHCAAVFGQSECERDEVKLIVVGGNPRFTTKTAFPRTKNDPLREYSNFPSEFFCRFLESVFSDEDYFLSHVFFTYAVKCPARIGRTGLGFKDKEIQTCGEWLLQELSTLPPKAPILITATEALKVLLPHLKGGLWPNRLKVHRFENHPVVVTIPFEEVEKCMLRRVTNQTERLGKPQAVSVEYEKLIVGSLPYFFRRDLQLLKSLYVY